MRLRPPGSTRTDTRVPYTTLVRTGCAVGTSDVQSVDDLIQKADIALDQAKNQGRGTCCYFNAEMQSVAEHKLKIEQDLAHAIGAGQLRLLYQPLISAADQSLLGFEALVDRKSTRLNSSH